MNKQPRIAILSAELAEYSLDQNILRSLNLQSHLEALKLSYKQMVGVYLGREETSFLVVLDTPEAEVMIQNLVSVYGQECYLIADEERRSELVYLNGARVALPGKLQAVSATTARAMDSYSRELDHSSYYVVV